MDKEMIPFSLDGNPSARLPASLFWRSLSVTVWTYPTYASKRVTVQTAIAERVWLKLKASAFWRQVAVARRRRVCRSSRRARVCKRVSAWS